MSYIDHDRKAIFVHVPKSAGNSMRLTLGYGLSGRHRTAERLIGKLDYFSWAFTRNPYDRALALYYGARMYNVAKVRDVHTFDQFLLMIQEQWDQHETFGDPTIAPMRYFLCDSSDKIIVDFTGRYENLVEDWIQVCHRLGITPQPLRLRYNKSGHEPWESCYNSQSVAIINELYQDDFEIFQYQKRTP